MYRSICIPEKLTTIRNFSYKVYRLAANITFKKKFLEFAAVYKFIKKTRRIKW